MSDQEQRAPSGSVPGNDELFRLIVESATDFAIITTDPHGVVTSWNIGAERVLGWTEGEAVGRSAGIIFTLEERESGQLENEMQMALAKGRAEDERWHQRKNGTSVWASGLMMPLAERSMGFVKIFQDRTEKRRLEAETRDARERFELLATNIPQLVFRCRGSGLRTWGSPQWEVFTGLTLEENVGFGWLDGIHPDDREVTSTAWEEAQRAREYYIEHRIRRDPDGEYRWHQTRARPVANGADDDWVGTSADIHDLRTLKDRQQVLMAELQHRTRNLLAVVQSIARQTLRTSASLEAFGDEFESRLGTLSRVQGLLAQVDQRELDLRTLIEAELAAHGDGDEHKVEVQGPPASLPATSAQIFALALHELATNAVKYGAFQEPSGRLSVRWAIEKDRGEQAVVLDWIESGVTMPDTAAPRRKGYGSELIQRALPYTLKAKTSLKFGPDGVHCRISVPTTLSQAETR